MATGPGNNSTGNAELTKQKIGDAMKSIQAAEKALADAKAALTAALAAVPPGGGQDVTGGT